jgi:hypothetical protein
MSAWVKVSSESYTTGKVVREAVQCAFYKAHAGHKAQVLEV